MRTYLLIFSIVILSCDRSPKLADGNELGKQVFEGLKTKDKQALMKYFISKKEMQQIFGSNGYNKTISKERQQELIDILYDSEKKIFSKSVDYYMSEESVDAKKIQSGIFKNCSFTEGISAIGIPVTIISTFFSTDKENYKMIIKAANFDNYWKLVSGIEVIHQPTIN